MSNNMITVPPVLSTGRNGEDQTMNLDEYLNSDFIESQILSDIFSEYLSIAFNQPAKIKR